LKPALLPELRLRRLWCGMGFCMVLVIAYTCLAPPDKLPDPRVWDKSIHLLAFGTLGFWFGSIVVRRDLPWLALALVAFGGLIELAQGAMPFGRRAELFDLAADSLGILLGLALALTPLGRWPRWMEGLVCRTAS
jgi:VanZ family protein